MNRSADEAVLLDTLQYEVSLAQVHYRVTMAPYHDLLNCLGPRVNTVTWDEMALAIHATVGEVTDRIDAHVISAVRSAAMEGA